jgi:hypothetical protein
MRQMNVFSFLRPLHYPTRTHVMMVKTTGMKEQHTEKYHTPLVWVVRGWIRVFSTNAQPIPLYNEMVPRFGSWLPYGS